jgi:hypothetical protein
LTVAVDYRATPVNEGITKPQRGAKASDPISLYTCISEEVQKSNWKTLLLLKKKKPGRYDFAEEFTNSPWSLSAL